MQHPPHTAPRPPLRPSGYRRSRGVVMTSKNDVKAWLTASITVAGAQPLVATARLTYDAREPYAVRLAITQRQAAPVEWIFARELLVVGLTRSAGAGDVVVMPAADSQDGELFIALTGSSGSAVVTVPSAEVEDFVIDTCLLVPLGTEFQHIDIDAALARLLVA